MNRTLIAGAIVAGLSMGVSGTLQAREEVSVADRQREEPAITLTEKDFVRRGGLGLADIAHYTAGLNCESFGSGSKNVFL